MKAYPCGRCKNQEVIGTDQWFMVARLDDRGNFPKYVEGERCGVERFDLDAKCSEAYRAGINQILESQRRENNGRLLAQPHAAALKDGWHPGEVIVLSEDNYDSLRTWAYNRSEKLEPKTRDRRLAVA